MAVQRAALPEFSMAVQLQAALGYRRHHLHGRRDRALRDLTSFGLESAWSKAEACCVLRTYFIGSGRPTRFRIACDHMSVVLNRPAMWDNTV